MKVLQNVCFGKIFSVILMAQNDQVWFFWIERCQYPATVSLQDIEGFKHCHGPIFVRKWGNKALEAVTLGRNLVQVLVSFFFYFLQTKIFLKGMF